MTPIVLNRQVRRHFSDHAGEYDRYAVVQKRVVRHLLELIPISGVPAGPAVDLGCGTGELSRQFAERFPETPLVIADIAHDMTRSAGRQVAGGLSVDADAAELPLRNECCALLLSSSMYQWVGNLRQAFSENHRVLRSGGTFVFALFGAGTLSELRASHQAALAASGAERPSHMHDFPSPEVVSDALRHAGFQAEIGCYSEVEEHPDVATLLRNLKRIGAQNAAAERPSGLAARQVTVRMMDIYASRFGRNGRIPATYQIICGVARKS